MNTLLKNRYPFKALGPGHPLYPFDTLFFNMRPPGDVSQKKHAELFPPNTPLEEQRPTPIIFPSILFFFNMRRRRCQPKKREGITLAKLTPTRYFQRVGPGSPR